MTNIEKLNGIFAEVFSVEATVLTADFNKCSVEGWDSVHQLSLTSSMEDAFDITIPARDIVPENFNSAEAMYAMVQRLLDD